MDCSFSKDVVITATVCAHKFSKRANAIRVIRVMQTLKWTYYTLSALVDI